MNSIQIVIVIKVVILLTINLLYGCAAGNLSPEQQAEVDRLLVSSFELPAYAKRVFLTPGGILEVETTDSEGDYEKGSGQRTLIDLNSMKRIWSGTLEEGYMITDTPSLILVKKNDGRHRLVRYDRQGRLLWESDVEGLFVFGLAVDEDNMLLSLSLRKTGDDSVHAVISGTGLDDGRNRWLKDLGSVSFGDVEVGSLWRYNNRPVFAYRGNVYLLLENRAICLSAANGRIYSDWKIPFLEENAPAGDTIWVPHENDVVVLSGQHVIAISGNSSRNWTVDIGKKVKATEAMQRGHDLVVAFRGEDELGVGVLDLVSRSWRWKNADEAGSGIAPRGLVAAGDAIAVASNGRLHGYDAETGERLYTEDLSGRNAQKLIANGNNMAIIGPDSIEVRRVSDGNVIWSREDIDTPLAMYYSKRGSSMASIQASMQGTAAIAANSSRYYYGMASSKIGGSYAYDAWSRSQYSSLSNIAARSSAASEFASSLAGGAQGSASFIDRMVSVIVDMQYEAPDREWAYFLVPLKSGFVDYETNTAKLLALRLADGFSYDIPVRAASPSCIPAAMASEEQGLIVEAYHRFPFCKRDHFIDILRLPPAPH